MVFLEQHIFIVAGGVPSFPFVKISKCEIFHQARMREQQVLDSIQRSISPTKVTAKPDGERADESWSEGSEEEEGCGSVALVHHFCSGSEFLSLFFFFQKQNLNFKNLLF